MAGGAGRLRDVCSWQVGRGDPCLSHVQCGAALAAAEMTVRARKHAKNVLGQT